MKISAPTGIPTIKQTPKGKHEKQDKEGKQLPLMCARELKLRVAAWVLPSVDEGMSKQIHHFVRLNQVMRSFDSVLQHSFGRATLNYFDVPRCMSHRDARQWTKAEHLAAAANAL